VKYQKYWTIDVLTSRYRPHERNAVLKGFKEFILRGNVVELATAVIIGGAFTAIVTAFTSSIIEPLFAAIPTGSCDSAPAATEAAEGTIAGPIQSCPLGFKILSDNEATFMDFGALLTAIINFLIIAAVVYFLIVMPYTKLSELRKKDDEEDGDDEVSLLTEIRDLLDADGTIAAKKKAAEEKEAAEKAAAAAIPTGATQRFATPPPAPQGPPPGGPGFNAPGGPPQFGAPPPAGGFPTPPPAQGNYPAPGSYPGQFPEGEFPGDDGPRHSR
jgi:large conductance mechanosensitive channel